MKHLVIGYHGTDLQAARDLEESGLDPSRGARHSWLGPGLYFWEQDEDRAWRWCRQRRKKPPAVLKAQLDLSDRALDLTTERMAQEYRKFVKGLCADPQRRAHIERVAALNEGFGDALFLGLFRRALETAGYWGAGNKACALRAVVLAGGRYYQGPEVELEALTAFPGPGRQGGLARSRVVTSVSTVVVVWENGALRQRQVLLPSE